MSVTHLSRGSAGYRRATLALFCAGFATFAMLYCVQPLLPLLAAHFRVSAASSSLALSLTTLSLALCLLVSGALAESWGRKPVMVAALGLAALALERADVGRDDIVAQVDAVGSVHGRQLKRKRPRRKGEAAPSLSGKPQFEAIRCPPRR